MSKLLNLVFIGAFLYFVYWMIKRHFKHRQLEAQGIVIQEQGMRPITLFAIVMVVCYGAYMLWFFIAA